MNKVVVVFLFLFISLNTVQAQNKLIRANIDTLLSLIPNAPDTLIQDNPMFETPNVHAQHTFELTQLYYDKSTPMNVIQFKIQDYSINPDYYQEQAIEVFNLDKNSIINHSDTLMGYDVHYFKDETQTVINMFLGEYLIAEIRQEGGNWDINQLKAYLKRFPINELRERFLIVSKLYRRTTVKKVEE